jgi:chlorobactene glucosyltransferase
MLDYVGTLSAPSIWFWLLVLIGLVWLRRHLQLSRADRDPALSAADADDGPGPLPPLTVLVAAKDEEANIGTCLAGLLAQDYPGLQIVVCNDRSTDRTPRIIDELASRDARLKPVHIAELPAGWAGKNHALHQGMCQVTTEYVCFTDADCRYHSPKLLAAAMRTVQRQGLDFLSALPQLEAHTFWERVVQPPAGAIMVFWFPPEKVNDPQSPRAYANGAFMLMSRRAYDTLGGHARVRTALNEDMHFARRAKQLGMKLRVLRGGQLYSVRMYVGLRQIWNGWSRIFYGCFGTLPRLIVSAIFLSVFSVLPYLSMLLSPLAGDAAPGVAGAAAFAVAAQQSVLWRFYRLCQVPAPWALAYPLGAGLCLGMVLNAMTRHLGTRTRWRGTTYHGGA